jgi:hypothetical protein
VLAVEALQRLLAVGGRDDVVALLLKRVAEELLNRLLVVDEQDACRFPRAVQCLTPRNDSRTAVAYRRLFRPGGFGALC